MGSERIVFSPVTRLSGLLSVQVVLDDREVMDANVSSTMFRGFEWIMQGRHITDAVYLTQRVCGICSLAHGAVASYLVDGILDNDLSENAQYLRNIMLGADFLQNLSATFIFLAYLILCRCRMSRPSKAKILPMPA